MGAWDSVTGWGDDFVSMVSPGHGAGGRAAEKQEAAANAASIQQQQQAGLGLNFLEGQTVGANHAAQDGTDQGASLLQRYGNQGQGYLAGGLNSATGAMQQGTQSGLSSLGAGYGQARGDLGQVAGLQGYAGAAASGYNPYDVTGAGGRMGALADGGLGAGFQADPGYQFRLQQGEQAINRAASAQGGRNSGRTLQALQAHGQDLASQEFGNYANRAMGMAGAADQSNLAAMMNQAGRSDAAMQQQRGAQMQLAQAGLGAQSQLGQLAYGYGSQAGGMQQGLGQGLAGLYQGTANQQAGLAGQTGSQLGNMYSGLGQTISGNFMNEAGLGAGLYGSNIQAIGAPVQFAGGKQAAQANQQASTLNSGSSILGAYMGGG